MYKVTVTGIPNKRNSTKIISAAKRDTVMRRLKELANSIPMFYAYMGSYENGGTLSVQTGVWD